MQKLFPTFNQKRNDRYTSCDQFRGGAKHNQVGVVGQLPAQPGFDVFFALHDLADAIDVLDLESQASADSTWAEHTHTPTVNCEHKTRKDRYASRNIVTCMLRRVLCCDDVACPTHQ